MFKNLIKFMMDSIFTKAETNIFKSFIINNWV
jgi:hypothetical protein